MNWVKKGHLKWPMVEIRMDDMTREYVVKSKLIFFFNLKREGEEKEVNHGENCI